MGGFPCAARLDEKGSMGQRDRHREDRTARVHGERMGVQRDSHPLNLWVAKVNWYVHYTVKSKEGAHKCVEGPYSQDQVLDRRRELGKTFPDASVSEKAKADESSPLQTP